MSKRISTVAIIGPDGSGKSTLIAHLERELSPRPRRIYMGVNPAATTHALPTTRFLWFVKKRLNKPLIDYERMRLGDVKPPTRPKKLHKRVLADLKSTVFVANRIGEEWYRQGISWLYQRRGAVVLFDRHFYLDHMMLKLTNPDQKRTLLAWRLHDYLIERLYPKPQLTLYLDAAPEILFARKPEVPIERLAKMRHAYHQMRDLVPAFAVVDTSVSIEDMLAQAKRAIAAAASPA